MPHAGRVYSPYQQPQLEDLMTADEVEPIEPMDQFSDIGKGIKAMDPRQRVLMEMMAREGQTPGQAGAVSPDEPMSRGALTGRARADRAARADPDQEMVDYIGQNVGGDSATKDKYGGPATIRNPDDMSDDEYFPDTVEEFVKLHGRKPATDREVEFYYGSDELVDDVAAGETLQAAKNLRR